MCGWGTLLRTTFATVTRIYCRHGDSILQPPGLVQPGDAAVSLSEPADLWSSAGVG